MFFLVLMRLTIYFFPLSLIFSCRVMRDVLFTNSRVDRSTGRVKPGYLVHIGHLIQGKGV